MEMEKDKDHSYKFHSCQSNSALKISNHTKFHKASNSITFSCVVGPLAWLKCEFCEFNSNFKVNMTEHYRVFHENKKFNEELEDILKCYYCENCNFDTYSVLVLTKHVVSCDGVSKIKSTRACGITRKQNKHFWTIKNINWLECDLCVFKTKWRHHLHRHIIAMHTNPEEINWFYCDQCEFKTKQKANLKPHFIAKHDTNWFRCAHCGFKTKTRSNMEQHRISKHSRDTRSQDAVWSRHSNHDKINWFKCAQCPYKTKTESHLKRHVTSKHTDSKDLKRFKCEQCAFKAKQKCHLKEHVIWKHTKPEDVIWFRCDQCDFKTKQKSVLKRHITLRHIKTKQKSVLRRHITLRHIGKENYFKCMTCLFETNQENYLIQHVLQIHTNTST